MTERRVQIFLLSTVAIVSIIGLVTISIQHGGRSGTLDIFSEETIAGQASTYSIDDKPISATLAIDESIAPAQEITYAYLETLPAARDPSIIKFVFGGDIRNAEIHTP